LLLASKFFSAPAWASCCSLCKSVVQCHSSSLILCLSQPFFICVCEEERIVVIKYIINLKLPFLSLCMFSYIYLGRSSTKFLTSIYTSYWELYPVLHTDIMFISLILHNIEKFHIKVVDLNKVHIVCFVPISCMIHHSLKVGWGCLSFD
jgi:hypothetical protein